MSGPMSVSMTIKLIDEFSSGAAKLTGVVRELKAAGEAFNTTPVGRPANWDGETTAVQGVIAQVGELKTATINAAEPIGAATAKLEAEARAVETVIKTMHDLKAATAEAAAAGAAGTATGAGEEPSGMTPEGSFDWQGMKAPPHKGPIAGVRASDWVEQQKAIEDADAAATRASEHIRGLEEDMARLGMAGMAFGQLRSFGEGLRKPIETAEDLFADFQAKTQDLATRSENNGGQAAIGEHIMRVAREANVPWEQVYEGEQSLASLGGGKQLQAMAGFETRMNKLALAGHIEAADIYSAMMHYIKGGLSAAEALDALEQQHVQGKRGAVELNQLARYMPTLSALGKEFGMTPQQSVTDVSALMQIARANVGTAGQAETIVRQAMIDLGAPRKVKRLEKDLDIDGFAVRAEAKARGENPMFALLNVIADKFDKMTPDQKGTVVPNGSGGGTVSGGDPKIMGDLARNYYFRALLDAFIQHRGELPDFNVPVEEARKTTDEDYAGQNSTVRQARQAAANAKAEAEIRAGRTQEGLMKMTAGAQGGIWDAGGWVAQTMPGTTGVVGAGTGLMGSALTAMGRLGEAAVGLATTFKAAQWVGAKYPAVGNAAEMMVKGPYDLATGFAQGIREGASQGMAEAAGKVAVEPAANGLSKLGTAAELASSEFGAASTSLGTLGLLFGWAAQKDVLSLDRFAKDAGLTPAGASAARPPARIDEAPAPGAIQPRMGPIRDIPISLSEPVVIQPRMGAIGDIPITPSITAAITAAFEAHKAAQPAPRPPRRRSRSPTTNRNM